MTVGRRSTKAGRWPLVAAAAAAALVLGACDDEVPGDPAGNSQQTDAVAPDPQVVEASCDELAADLGADDGDSLRDAVRDRPLVDVLGDLDDLQLMASSLRTVGDDVLPAGEPLTVFAPLDAALLPDGAAGGGDATGATELPADVLLRAHVAVGEQGLEALAAGAQLELLDGSLVTADVADGEPVVQRDDRVARVVCPDLRVADGVLHVVDAVLIVPEDDQAQDGAVDDERPGFQDDAVRDDLPERLDEDDVETGQGDTRSP